MTFFKSTSWEKVQFKKDDRKLTNVVHCLLKKQAKLLLFFSSYLSLLIVLTIENVLSPYLYYREKKLEANNGKGKKIQKKCQDNFAGEKLLNLK